MTGACRPGVPALRPDQATADERTAEVRGATVYTAYCGGCHGAKGRGDGPVAGVINIRPANLQTSRLFDTATDDELLDRLMHGTPVRSTPRPHAIAEDLQTDAIVAYVASLSARDWELLRVGRFVYERTCASCHGAYGDGVGVLGAATTRRRPI